MKDNVQKIREAVEKLKSNLMYGACSSQVAMETRCKEEAYNEMLAILDTMQEEPVSEFLNTESMIESYKQRLISQANGVKNSPLIDMCLASYKHGINETLDTLNLSSLARIGKNWKEPVSEELEDTTQTITYEGEVYTRCYKDKLDAFACKYPMLVPKPSKRYAKYSDVDLTIAVKKGAQWQKEQFEKERLKHCDELTNEQAQIESDFVTQHLKENNRTPTFINAIEYGMRLKEKEMQSTIELAEDHAMLAGMEKMKEQMMAKAIDVELYSDGMLTPIIKVNDKEKISDIKFGDKVKIIIIKEDRDE